MNNECQALNEFLQISFCDSTNEKHKSLSCYRITKKSLFTVCWNKSKKLHSQNPRCQYISSPGLPLQCADICQCQQYLVPFLSLVQYLYPNVFRQYFSAERIILECLRRRAWRNVTQPRRSCRNPMRECISAMTPWQPFDWTMSAPASSEQHWQGHRVNRCSPVRTVPPLGQQMRYESSP